jgi:hypothetical protein
MAFYRMLLVATQNIGLKRSTADPCLYYKWEKESLVIMISWIDNNMILGQKDVVMQFKANLMKKFKCRLWASQRVRWEQDQICWQWHNLIRANGTATELQ